MSVHIESGAGLRPRAQSCSTPPTPGSCLSPTAGGCRRPSQRHSERRSSKKISSKSPQLSVPASPQSHRSRRPSPATIEATKLALAARAEYSKRRSSKCLEKAAFYIVTKEDDKLDDLEMAVLLNKSRKESICASASASSSARPGTPSSHRSTGAESTGTRGGEGKRSPSVTASIGSERQPSHHNASSPKRTPRQGRRSSSTRKIRLASFSSDVVTPTLSPPSPMLRIFQGGGGGRRASKASNDSSENHRHHHHHHHRRHHRQQQQQQQMDESISTGTPCSCDDKDSIATKDGKIDGSSAGKKGGISSLSSSPSRPSVVKLAIAGAVMLTGTCAFIVSYVVGRGETWTIVGSSIMGVGSLLVLLGICWYLASTQDRVGEGGDPVEIKMVDHSQLARLIKKGACVKTITVHV